MAQQRFFFQGGGGTFQQLFSCRFVCNHQGQTPGSFFLFWGAKLLTRKPSPVLVNYSIGGHVPVVTDEGQKEKEGGQDVRSAHNTGNLCNATKNKCQWIRETIWQYALLVYSDDGSSIPLTFCAGQQNLSTSTSYPSCKSSPSPSLFHRIESILSSYTSRKTANPSIHPSRHERKTPTTAPDREREREGRLLPLFLFLFLLFFLPIFCWLLSSHSPAPLGSVVSFICAPLFVFRSQKMEDDNMTCSSGRNGNVSLSWRFPSPCRSPSLGESRLKLHFKLGKNREFPDNIGLICWRRPKLVSIPLTNYSS